MMGVDRVVNFQREEDDFRFVLVCIGSSTLIAELSFWCGVFSLRASALVLPIRRCLVVETARKGRKGQDD